MIAPHDTNGDLHAVLEQIPRVTVGRKLSYLAHKRIHHHTTDQNHSKDIALPTITRLMNFDMIKLTIEI